MTPSLSACGAWLVVTSALTTLFPVPLAVTALLLTAGSILWLMERGTIA